MFETIYTKLKGSYLKASGQAEPVSLIYVDGWKIIEYGVIDFSGLELEYFFSPEDLIEWLKQQEQEE